jgi:hypothetical protein
MTRYVMYISTPPIHLHGVVINELTRTVTSINIIINIIIITIIIIILLPQI